MLINDVVVIAAPNEKLMPPLVRLSQPERSSKRHRGTQGRVPVNRDNRLVSFSIVDHNV